MQGPNFLIGNETDERGFLAQHWLFLIVVGSLDPNIPVVALDMGRVVEHRVVKPQSRPVLNLNKVHENHWMCSIEGSSIAPTLVHESKLTEYYNMVKLQTAGGASDPVESASKSVLRKVLTYDAAKHAGEAYRIRVDALARMDAYTAEHFPSGVCSIVSQYLHLDAIAMEEFSALPF